MNGEFIMMTTPQFCIAVLVEYDGMIDRDLLIYLRDMACQALPWVTER